MNLIWVFLGGIGLIILLVFWLTKRSERLGRAKVLQDLAQSEEEKRARLADLPASSKPELIDRLRKGGF